MSKHIFMAAGAICLSISNLCSEPLERTFGPDQQRGHRPERFSNQAPNTTRSPKPPITEFSSQQRQGVWARWYYQKIHNLMPDE
jgi:hypothetical protein